MTNKDEISKEAQKYEKLNNISKHEGWPILVDIIQKVKITLIDALLKEEDHKKIIILQERYKAYDSILTIISSAKDIRDKFVQDVLDIFEEDRFRQDFDL